MYIDSFEQLTTRIGRLRLRRCGSIPALTIFVAYAPTSSYDDEEIEAFYMDLEKLGKTTIPTSTPRQRRESRGFKRRLTYEILELIHHCGAARAAGNYQLPLCVNNRTSGTLPFTSS
ncbi:hypothetical protein ANCDUO_07439 [Ancylostoma duodenale]|uniref:Uncharacterized protein n=1 Tax=Ancylostoma duodenale TaxID=51022 RepID=A0A0C2DIH5_9BILA|nr:hypothetical protein ANCDUO_07439 [Ancylostoma duodenale]